MEATILLVFALLGVVDSASIEFTQSHRSEVDVCSSASAIAAAVLDAAAAKRFHAVVSGAWGHRDAKSADDATTPVMRFTLAQFA